IIDDPSAAREVTARVLPLPWPRVITLLAWSGLKSQCLRLRIRLPMNATVVEPSESSCRRQSVRGQKRSAPETPKNHIGQLPKKCPNLAPHNTEWYADARTDNAVELCSFS